MKKDKLRESLWMSDQGWAGVGPNEALNVNCATEDLNTLRERVTDLRKQLVEAKGDHRISILTSLVDCDLRAKFLIHTMLKELISEMCRLHCQGYDIHQEMMDAEHSFAQQFYNSLNGFVLHREFLQHLIEGE